MNIMKNTKSIIFGLIFVIIVSYSYTMIDLDHIPNQQNDAAIRNKLNTSSSIFDTFFLWNRTWGGDDHDIAYCVAIDSFNDIYMAGYTNGGDYTALIKYNSSGYLLWNKTLGLGIARDIAFDSLNNVYLTSSGGSNVYIIKYNKNGDFQWSKTWGGDDYEDSKSIVLDSNDNIYIGGSTGSFGAGGWYDMFLLKYNSSGDFQWQKLWGGSSSDYCNALTIDSEDNIYASGNTYSFGTGGDLFLIKYNSSGDELFTRLWGGAESDGSVSMTMDSNENLYLGGWTKSFGVDGWDVCLLKYNKFGDLQWDKTWGMIDDQELFGIELDSKNDIYITGGNGTRGYHYNNLLVKFNNSGNEVWNFTWGDSLDENDFCQGIAIDSENNIYTAGYFITTPWTGTFEMVLYKFRSTPLIFWITTPVSNQLYGTEPPSFNLNFLESGINTTWYSLNDGETYISPGTSDFIDSTAWMNCADGNVSLKFYVNNSRGIITNAQVIIQKDTTPPLISLDLISQNQLFGNQSPNFEISILDNNPDKMWYTVDNGLNNHSFVSTWENINQVAWDNCNNGSVNVTFYANDTVGNIDFKEILIYKDIYAPYIEIIKPELLFLYGNYLNYDIIKYGININTTWYTINNGLKYEFDTLVGELNLNAWNNADDGIISLKFFINDSHSREVFSDVRIFKDTTDPTIIINSPTPNIFFSNSSPNYDVSISDENFNTTWYTIDGGLTNTTITENLGKIDQTKWNLLEDGNITIKFYANDTVNNIAFKEVVVRKDVTKPVIAINSPITNELYLNSIPLFNISISELNLNESWYTINNGLKYFLTNSNGEINQSAWELCSDGYVNITFYANDFSGNLGFNSVKIRKNLESREAYAIVIGISDYPGSSNDLNYCDDDAIAVYNMLLNDYNFRSENIIYLQDSSASKADIDNAFATITSLIGPGDIFFFYYSGHGGHGTYSTQGSWNVETSHPYLNNYDQIWSVSHPGAIAMRVHFERFQLENNYDYILCGNWGVTQGYYYEELTGDLGLNVWSSYIPVSNYYIRFISDSSNPFPYYGFKIDKYEAILEDGTHYLCSYDSIPSNPSAYYMDTLLDSKLDTINCADKYVVLDSCNSGGLIPEVQDIGRYIMTACRGTQESTESPTLEHGTFTNYLLESTENANDQNEDGVISLEENYDYVYSHTVAYSGSNGDPYHPQESDGIIGESVIYPSLAAVNYEFSDNTLNYSFFLYGHGMLKTVNITVCSVEPAITLNTFNLRSQVTSTTGFGFYEGILEIDQGNFASGFEIYIEIEGNKVIIFNQTFGDSDGDGLTDFFEIMEGSGLNPSSNDTDNDELSDYDEFYGPTDPLNPDSDSDGLLDGEEVNIYNTNPLIDDTDSDGLLDGEEVNTYATDPLQEDSDSDSLSDGYEINNSFTNPLNNDTDSDSLSDGSEVNIYTTNPLSNDTDSDDLSDPEEIFTYYTNPLSNDTDSDGLLDGEEVNTFGTNPLNADSDSDGLSDYDELNTHNTDPLNEDTDLDTMPDGWEVDNSLDPFTNDTTLDPDNDLLTNIEEFQHGTLAMNNDTDSDGLLDGEEVFTFNTKPTIGDTDSDGLLDGEEVNLYNTDPLDDDTDSDGLLDGVEVNIHNTDPLSGDTDADTMPDKWEVDYSLNPLTNDTMLDPDSDDLVNILEYQQNTNPQNPDTDLDGWTDGDEVLVYNTDPLDPNDHPTSPPPAGIPGYNIIIVISIVGWMSLVLIRKKKFNAIFKKKI